MNTIKLKLNSDFKGLKAGSTIELPLNSSGKIKDKFWRNRLRDATRKDKFCDNCVTVVEPKAATKIKPKEPVENDNHITA